MKKTVSMWLMGLCALSAVTASAQTSVSAIESKKQTLFSSVNHESTPYRIPAVAKLNNGTVLAIADQRPCGADVGNGEVDIYAKVGTIDANGKYTWNPATTDPSANGGMKIADGTSSNGYGDAAVVVDRESGKVLVICVAGKVVFSSGSSSKHNKMARIVGSADGLTWESPQDVTSQFFANELSSAYTMFMASGRMVQSEKVKVGNYYRIYGALLVREKSGWFSKSNNNYVVYSDDFGATWNVLGGTYALKGGDEAKVEELPNGDIVMSSRTSGGRYFNVFKFSNLNNATGSWGSATKYSFAGSNSTNGELLFYKGLVDANGTEYNVMLQSLPTGSSRSNVAVYYKAFATDKSSWSVSDFTSGWTKGIEVDNGASGYSTMTILPNGEVGFLYEDDYNTSKADGDYSNIVYVPLTVEEITGGKFCAPASNDTEEPAVPVETPAFSIKGGEVEEGTQVTISCATEGATVYYTTDGSAPSTSSAKYTGAITVSKAMTIKAIAVKDGYYTNSQVASASFTIKAREVVATPAFSISGGEVEEGTQVTISCATSGATVYYTTDGSAPSTSSAKYTGAITISKAMTIKAIAVKDGYYTNSQVASATFTIKGKEVVATPAISPNGGEYESSATVTLTCATEGATIYYTTDGSIPTTTSAIYSKPFTLTESATVKAIAVKDGYYTNSAVSSAVFTITQPAPEPEPEPEPEEPTNACGDYLTWEYAGGVLTISGEGDMYDFDSAQDAPWASVAAQVTSIVLPDEITRIGNNAFAGCSKVSSLTFDDNDCVFGTNAFNSKTKTYLVIDDTEKKDFAMHANKYYLVTIKRKLSSTNYGTIIMPFAPSTTTKNSFKFYQLRNTMGSYIYYSRVYSPSANVPYLYKNSSSSSSKWASEIVSSNNVTIKATEKPSVSSGNWTTVGSYKNMYITDQDSLSYHYAMSNNSLMNFNQSLSIYPLRAYFEGPVYDSNARQMQLVILDDDDATHIYIVQGDEQEQTEAYDLQGRKVNKLVPGNVYIINGKKVLFEQ